MKRTILVSLILVFTSNIHGQNNFLGEWELKIIERGFVMEGLLKITTENGKIIGSVEGGPIKIKIHNSRIEMGIDDRTAAGMPFERYLQGSISNNLMSGSFGPENEPTKEIKELCKRLPLGCPAPKGTWTAEPHIKKETQQQNQINPIDISGTWIVDTGGIRRWSANLTEFAQNWKNDFDVTMDLPAQRCQPSGLFLSWGFRGNEPEIFQNDEKITMIIGSTVRRIYLNGIKPPEYTEWFPMGFSSGHWESNKLIIKTSHLKPTVREWMGDPISENAEAIEEYSIDDEGRLVGILTLHDPTNYKEPMIKRARWKKDNTTKIRFPSLCDPDSFYRELYDDQLLEKYWKRSHRRY